MSVYVFPTFEDPFYEYSTILEGVAYTFRFRCNTRELCWYLRVGLPDGTDLLTGIKVIPQIDLLWRKNVDTRLPPGKLVALATGTNTEHPSLLDFGAGKRVELVYYDSEEV